MLRTKEQQVHGRKVAEYPNISSHHLVSFSTLGITATIKNSFEMLGISNWESKLIGFGADGASVNMGKKAGVASKLKQDTPWLIDIHCLPHRLELAMLEFQRSCATVEKVYTTLNLIWKTYHFNPKSTRELKALADTMGIGALKPGQVKGTRWLPHVSRALKCLIKPPKGDPKKDPGQYAVVLQHMEHLASTSQNAEIKGRAKYIAAAMKEIDFLAFCHFLADLFSILETISLKFQQNDLILPSVVSLLREMYTRVSLLAERAAPGGWLESFEKIAKRSDDKVLFQGLMVTRCPPSQRKKPMNLQSEIEEAVSLCQQGFKERFRNLLDATSLESSNKEKSTTGTIIQDMLVFNANAWPHDSNSLADFGSEEIGRLVTWFEPVLKKGGCNIEAVPRQWVSLKMMVKTQFQDMSYSRLWSTMLTKEPYKSDYQDVLHLVEILLVLPISSAQCERAFSAQNRIKSAQRSCLDTETTEDLIRISAEGPPVNEFDPSLAVGLWFSNGEKPRRPFFKHL